MKHFITIILCAISFFCSIDISANPGETPKCKDEKFTIFHRTKKPTEDKPRHEIPGRVLIKCFYTETHLRFEFPSNVRSIMVSIGDDEAPVWQTFVTVENPECDIPELHGEYEITCRTDGNQIFKGKLQFAN